MTTRLVIVGAGGRMGQRLLAVAAAAPDLVVAGAVDVVGPSLVDLDPAGVDVVIDFSVRAQVATTAAWVARHCKPLVLGTTGLDEDDQAAVAAAARETAVLAAPNFSVGVNVLFDLVGRAAKMLGESFDLEVVEAHHHHKVDAPSGTARRLGEALAEARGWNYDEVAVGGREGLVGAREPAEIGMHALRGGDIVGTHTVYYLGDGERVEITHRATDRDIFVRGALRAARWLASGREPGRYGMADVLSV